MSDGAWIIIIGTLAAVSCGLPGCFLILRKMAMTADAVSHAVLPGIVLAWLLTGRINSLAVVAGAGLFGVLTSSLIEFLHKRFKLQNDASVGIVYTFLFALGIILVSLYAGHTDLDTDCVLFGDITYTPLDTLYTSGGISLGPRSVWILGTILLLNITFVVLGYRKLFITSFDAVFAAASGISVALWHYALMTMVSLTAVSSFESVGSVLVIALMTVPPAAAYMLTHALKKMLLLTCLFGALSASFGYFLASLTDSSVAGSIGIMAGIILLVAFFLSPQYGFRRLKMKHKF